MELWSGRSIPYSPTAWCGCLGDYFLSLDSSASGFVVTVSGPGKAYHTETEHDAADAYARAALYVLGVEQPSIVS